MTDTMTWRIFDMTILTYPRGGFEPASCRSGRRDTATAVLKRFYRRALGPLLAGGALAGLIAIRAAIFLSRVNY